MKRHISVKYLIIAVFLIIAVIIYNGPFQSQMLRQAIQKSGLKIDKIIENIDLPEGTIVFFTEKINNDQYLHCGYLKKLTFGWEWTSGGVMNGSSDMPSAYIPCSEETPYSVAYGYINNKNITKVKLHIDDEKEMYADIKRNDDIVIWYKVLGKKNYNNVEAIGISDTGESIRTYKLIQGEKAARVSEFNLGKFKVEHSDIYGGAYYDSNGSFTINIVEGSNIDNIPELKELKAKINYVKYSLKNLEDIMDLLNKNLNDSSKSVELGITSVDLNEQENRVNVYIQDINDDKINKVKQICDSQVIQFKNNDSSTKVQF